MKAQIQRAVEQERLAVSSVRESDTHRFVQDLLAFFLKLHACLFAACLLWLQKVGLLLNCSVRIMLNHLPEKGLAKGACVCVKPDVSYEFNYINSTHARGLMLLNRTQANEDAC